MRGAGALRRALVGSAGPSQLPAIAALLSSGRVAALSWPAIGLVQQLSSAAPAPKGDRSDDEQQQQAQQASSSGGPGAGSQAGAHDGAGSSSSGAGAEQQEASSSGGGGFGGLGDGFASFRQRFGGSSSSSSGDSGGEAGTEPLQARAARLWRTVRAEVADAVLPRQEQVSLTRAYEGPTYQAPDTPYEGATAIATVKAPQSKFSKLLSELHDKFGHHPLFAKLRRVDIKDNPVYRKGAELADDLRDKYETSDHPAVHRVEDVREKLFGMSETAAAMATIRARDPRFDMTRLLAGVRFDAPLVVKAFLTHDLASLRRHCGPELLERMGGMFRAFEAQDAFEDPTILFTSDPELVELKLVEGEPLVVVQFSCQQIKCTRDKFGNVVDGDPNAIQRVFYFWGLQQEEVGAITADGRVLPPRWVIKDMMWQATLMLA